MTSDNRLNCAVIGFGWWGQHILRRLDGHAKISVPVVVEPATKLHTSIRDAGAEPAETLSDVLSRDDIDAIILTTPNPMHEAQVKECAAAGKHVFCEKPLGLTAASAKRSVEACKAAGVTLGIGHERRFEPAMKALRAELEAGSLGTVMHAEAAFSHDKLIGVPASDWRTSKEVSPAAGMTAMGIHLSDLLISFFGRVDTVQALVGHRSLGWETGDVVTAQLGFKEGMTATFSAVLHTPHFIRMHVFGTDRWIEVLNESHPDTPGGKVRYIEAESGKDPVERIFEWSDAVVENLEAFREACLGISTYPFTPEEMVHNIEVLEAIAQSAETRETVHIADL